MPNENNPNTSNNSVEQAQAKKLIEVKNEPLNSHSIAAIVIITVLAAGAAYFFSKAYYEISYQDLGPRPVLNKAKALEAKKDLEALEQDLMNEQPLSESDEPQAIEQDLDMTDVDLLDKELNSL